MSYGLSFEAWNFAAATAHKNITGAIKNGEKKKWNENAMKKYRENG